MVAFIWLTASHTFVQQWRQRYSFYLSYSCMHTWLLCVYVRFFSFHFSALSITYSNLHTKACYFIIKHVLCVALFLACALCVCVHTYSQTPTLHHAKIFLCRAKACARVTIFLFCQPFLYIASSLICNGFGECARLESVVWTLLPLFSFSFGVVIPLHLEFWSTFFLLLLSFVSPLP